MKIFLASIGCRLNLSEIEKIAAELRAAGHEIVEDMAEAELAILNTCAVTLSACADSRKSIRRIANSGCPQIYVTGCYATIAPEVVKSLPAVAALFENAQKKSITSKLNDPIQSIASNPQIRIPLPGKSHRTRAFIKVQDGCNNHCTFCVTRIARGKSVSQSEFEIFTDIEIALNGGAKEIVLTGVNLGSWGKEFGDGSTLPKLITTIIQRFSPNRIRLSSLEPWDIDPTYFPIFEHPSFCRHLHLPLQAGCDSVLMKMGRNIKAKEYREIVQSIRKSIPDIAITTDVLVGFPVESEMNFLESLTFVKEMNFSGGHIFRYSPRPGTEAEKMKNIVSEREKKLRSKRMRQIIGDSSYQFMEKYIHQNVSVLWEKVEKKEKGMYLMNGLTDTFLRVNAVGKKNLQNMISEVKIVSIHNDYLVGQEI